MNKDKMKALIDSENGKGFSKNIDLSGYNFFKNNSFISFKISKVDGISVVNIKYIYSENAKDLINILAFCVNFWMGMKVKFIYYKEKKEENYAIKKLEDLGFTVLKNTSSEGVWKYEFKCIKGENPCSCPLKEAFS